MTTRAITIFASLTIICAVASGCVTTKKKYDRAAGIEARGDYIGAANAYIDVLRRDRNYAPARERFEEVGPLAIEQHLDRINGYEKAEDFVRAAGAARVLENFLSAASAVGVPLARPADLDELVEAIDRRAAEQHLEEADDAWTRGDFASAIRSLDAALSTGALDKRQSATAVRDRLEITVDWAEHDLDAERYRAAYGRAGELLPLLNKGDPLLDRVIDLQEQALRLGTMVVAFVPFGAEEEWWDEAPRYLDDDINHILEFEHWTGAPLFLAAVDMVELRRELRRSRVEIASPTAAARVGRNIGADLVVIGTMRRYVIEDTNVREKIRETRMRGRGGADTTYVELDFKRRLIIDINYEIVDTYSRRVVRRGSRSLSTDANVRDAHFEGDYRDLDIGNSARHLLSGDAIREATEELEADLIDRVTVEIADRIFTDLLAVVDSRG